MNTNEISQLLINTKKDIVSGGFKEHETIGFMTELKLKEAEQEEPTENISNEMENKEVLEALKKMPYICIDYNIHRDDYTKEELGELLYNILGYVQYGEMPQRFADRGLRNDFERQIKAVDYGIEQYIKKVVGGRKGGMKSAENRNNKSIIGKL